MANGILIITSPTADVKLANRLLLSLRDWEFDSGDRFMLLSTQAELLAFEPSGPSGTVTSSPLQEFPVNEWAGLSVREVEKIMLQHDKDLNTGLFLLLDEQGAAERTIIVAERMQKPPEEDEFGYTDFYNKTRVPWEAAYAMWCNLDLANMDFSDFIREDYMNIYKGGEQERWFEYKEIMKEGYYKKTIDKAEAAVKELVKLDLA